MRVSVADAVDIEPVALERVARLRNGKRLIIDADVGSIAVQLKEIDSRFHVVYHPDEALYVLELHSPRADGSIDEHFVGAYDELDGRLLHRARKIVHESYNVADELEAAEARADAAQAFRRREQVGAAADQLSHALKRDLSRHEIGMTRKSRAFIPGAFKP